MLPPAQNNVPHIALPLMLTEKVVHDRIVHIFLDHVVHARYRFPVPMQDTDFQCKIQIFSRGFRFFQCKIHIVSSEVKPATFFLVP